MEERRWPTDNDLWISWRIEGYNKLKRRTCAPIVNIVNVKMQGDSLDRLKDVRALLAWTLYTAVWMIGVNHR